MLPLAATLADPRSTEWLALELPCLWTTVIIRPLLLVAPCIIWHRIDVSDSHVVLSHAEASALIPELGRYRPALDPCTVRLVDPEAAALARETQLASPTSPENPVEALAPRAPDDTTSFRLRSSAPPPRQLSAESDTHLVCSQAVCPALAPTEKEPRPVPLPSTVTLTEPLPAMLETRSALRRPVDTDTPSLTLPPRAPTLTTLGRLPVIPWPVLQRADVSDSHRVLSQPVIAASTPTLLSPPAPSPAPCSVRLADPVVEKPLPGLAKLSKTLCTVHA